MADEKQEILGEMKMRSVPTGEGFKYFSGYYDSGEFATDFVTLYTYRNVGDVPKLDIVGRNIFFTFTVSEIDTALAVYRAIILEKWKKRANAGQR